MTANGMADYIDADNQLDIGFFVGEDGCPQPYVIEALRHDRHAVPFAFLPYRVPVPTQRDPVRLTGGAEAALAYTAFLRQNSRAPWMRWWESNTYVYVFADPLDAVAFRLFVDPL